MPGRSAVQRGHECAIFNSKSSRNLLAGRATNIIAGMHSIARDQMLPLRNDPRVLGDYTDNELGWWNATPFKMTLEHARG